jgi:hypothetical protein
LTSVAGADASVGEVGPGVVAVVEEADANAGEAGDVLGMAAVLGNGA